MRSILILLGFFLLGPSSRAANQVEGTWEVLEGCRLVSVPYNDGDSFLVKHDNKEYLFRLYYVDAPEVTDTYIDRVRDQARYFSIAEEQVTQTGELAARFTQKFLRGEFTVITQWEDARGSGLSKRYYALVQKRDQFLSIELIRAGLVRLYGMPTKDSWPGGVTPRSFLSRLKNNEREAQREEDGIWALATGSMQMSGLEALHTTTEADNKGQLPTGSSSYASGIPLSERINVNTATAESLDTLPGIGPALAARIIAARPINHIEALVQIPGISSNTLTGFRHMILTEDPPPPAFTVAFYQAEIDTYLNTEVTVHVASVSPNASPNASESPEGFRSVNMQTAYQGESGGSITAYIPDEFYDSFIDYYKQPGREFKGLLYSRSGEVVIVYLRK